MTTRTLLDCYRITLVAVLLVVFACGEFVSITSGHLPTYFLQYAAAVAFVVVLDRRLARQNQAHEAYGLPG